MEWIKRNKKILVSLLITSVVILMAEFFYLRSLGKSLEIERWELGLFISPVVVFYACFASLMYLSWFGNDKNGAFKIPLKIFYWLFNTTFFILITAIYLAFVYKFNF